MQILRSICAVFAGLVLISVIVESLEFGLVALVNGEPRAKHTCVSRDQGGVQHRGGDCRWMGRSSAGTTCAGGAWAGARRHSDDGFRMGARDSRGSAIDPRLDVGLFDRCDIRRHHDRLTAPTTPRAGEQAAAADEWCGYIEIVSNAGITWTNASSTWPTPFTPTGGTAV
jgi:hypothetical protein